MVELTIPKGILVGLCEFSKGLRYQDLLFFDIKDGAVKILSTDGYALGAWHHPVPAGDDRRWDRGMISAAAGYWLRRCRASHFENVRILIFPDRVQFETLSGEFSTPAEENNLDYRKVFPSHITNQPAHINPELLMEFVRCLGHFDKATRSKRGKPGTRIRVWQNGNEAALVTMPDYPNFAGVVMPFRPSDEHPVNGTPDWVFI